MRRAPLYRYDPLYPQVRFNPHHKPAGSPEGGQFDVAEGGGENAGSVKIGYDNPGGEWLEHERARAAEAKADGYMARGAVTAYTRDPVMLPVDVLKQVPGARGEVRGPGDAQYDRLLPKITAEGYINYPEGTILLRVDHEGMPFIIEGNTRVAVASTLGIKRIPAEVRWVAGGEDAGGDWTPAKVIAMATPMPKVKFNPHHKPAGTPEGGQFDVADGNGVEEAETIDIGPKITPSNEPPFDYEHPPKEYDGIKIAQWKFRAKDGQAVMAAADYGQRVIFINSSKKVADAFRDMKTESARSWMMGWDSSPDPNHLINHEIAHIRTFDALGEKGLRDLQKITVDNSDVLYRTSAAVSGQAQRNAAEFVAEVYAGKRGGVEFHPAVLQYYDHLLGGKELK